MAEREQPNRASEFALDDNDRLFHMNGRIPRCLGRLPYISEATEIGRRALAWWDELVASDAPIPRIRNIRGRYCLVTEPA